MRSILFRLHNNPPPSEHISFSWQRDDRSFIHLFIHSLVFSKHFPGSFLTHVVRLSSFPASYCLPVLDVMRSRLCFAVRAPFGRKFSRKSEIFKPLPTSAPSAGPGTQSSLAFTPSRPKKTLFKRESPMTHGLVSHTSGPFPELPEAGRKLIWGPPCVRCHGLWFFRKAYSFRTKASSIEDEWGM